MELLYHIGITDHFYYQDFSLILYNLVNMGNITFFLLI